eukprot:CAMPEP_0180228274 /NCGR_PEP_ID=MMETSP0987-20121128/24677_1 /TAXON_ID=697907 /ORGANISM="non described non described, Strain CCMP2293" /LENGTH=341 /DNA_ID=CAMNT_0022192459 /DNA_START=11 /DNA_END=1033 /DNA_ORIENTATION=-
MDKLERRQAMQAAKLSPASMEAFDPDSSEDDSEDGGMMGAMQDMMGGQGGEEFPLVRVFYGGVATAKKPEVVIVPEEPWRLCITQLTLGEKAPPTGTRITVKCGVDAGTMAVVGHIRVGAVETINLNSLEFPGGKEVKFEVVVQGKGAEGVEVHIAGFFEGMDTGEQYGEGEEGDSDEDSEGEDSLDEMDGVMGDEQDGRSSEGDDDSDDEDDEDEDMSLPPGRKAKVTGRDGDMEEITSPGVLKGMRKQAQDDDMDEDDEEEGEDGDDSEEGGDESGDDEESEEEEQPKRGALGKTPDTATRKKRRMDETDSPAPASRGGGGGRGGSPARGGGGGDRGGG